MSKKNLLKLNDDSVFETDVLLVGSGCSALYFALNAPGDLNITLISKSDFESSDSFLAQGGICVLRDEKDFDSFFQDTLKAGHFENDRVSIEIMINSSQEVIRNLIHYGVPFQQNKDGSYAFTREGCHSNNRIMYHKDITGKAITEALLDKVKELPNVSMYQYTTLIDIISEDKICYGGVIKTSDNKIKLIKAKNTVLATGGIGGLYKYSTNFPHLTGDSIAIAINHNIELKDIDYIQVHPTTFYPDDSDERNFLISESTRGEGAKLYGKSMKPFTNELLPRDILTNEIRRKMEQDNIDYVWEDLSRIGVKELQNHFPNIIDYCKERGYDPLKECIPVVPAQHYFMGGIKTDYEGRTSMNNLYAIGETACNGVHGKNRLASNSLLEAMVFAGRAAKTVTNEKFIPSAPFQNMDLSKYKDFTAIRNKYALDIKKEIHRVCGEKNKTGVPYKNEELEEIYV